MTDLGKRKRLSNSKVASSVQSRQHVDSVAKGGDRHKQRLIMPTIESYLSFSQDEVCKCVVQSTGNSDHDHVDGRAEETDNAGNSDEGEHKCHVRAGLLTARSVGECIFGAYTTEDANDE